MHICPQPIRERCIDCGKDLNVVTTMQLPAVKKRIFVSWSENDLAGDISIISITITMVHSSLFVIIKIGRFGWPQPPNLCILYSRKPTERVPIYVGALGILLGSSSQDYHSELSIIENGWIWAVEGSSEAISYIGTDCIGLFTSSQTLKPQEPIST